MTEDSGRDRVERWADFSASPEAIWAVIGDFFTFDTWYPGIESLEKVEIDGDLHRHMDLGDGAMLLEKLVEQGDHTIRYEIIDGPLPVANYRSTLTVFKEGDGARVFWSSSFEPLTPDADAVVAEIYEAGLRAIQARFD